MEFFKARHATRWFTRFVLAIVCCFGLVTSALPADNFPGPRVAADPGPRGGAANAGGTFAVLDNTNPAANQADLDFFAQTLLRFQEVDSVSGTIEGGSGLGPIFNQNSCAACHVHPAFGGSSPASNPQVANNFAHLDGATNSADLRRVLSATGPVREVRFILNSSGGLDGGVHDLFTIAGRTDAPGCTSAILPQPDFDQAIANNNAIFRIPTPLFGAGLVEMTSDETLQLNLAATASQRAALGIGGSFNTNGNDGTLTRFGWKAQNKSLLIFAGEAYNVEQGVTNELFESDRFPSGSSENTIASCTFNGVPEDATNTLNPVATTVGGGANPNLNTIHGTASEMSSDVVNFAAFARMLAPPTAVTSTSSQLNGKALFSSIGCNLCHSPTLVTENANGGANGPFPALQGVTFHPYSDFAIHHMGANLADGVSQGAAGPDQFRTAPLWGVGQRIFFLHDGRTSDLVAAIAAHSDSNGKCSTVQSSENFYINFGAGDINFQPSSMNQFCGGSEANQVIAAFDALQPSQQQDILNFLRSL
jgi:CxxC motif-containing protein (DUF1111 family)